MAATSLWYAEYKLYVTVDKKTQINIKMDLVETITVSSRKE